MAIQLGTIVSPMTTVKVLGSPRTDSEIAA
jgi:hypothetical protein